MNLDEQAALGPLGLCSPGIDPGISILRATRLVYVCISALSWHALALKADLQRSRKGEHTATSIASPLVETVLALVQTSSWQGILGKEGATGAIAAIITELVRPVPGLFEQLAVIVSAGCPLPLQGNGAATATEQQGTNPRSIPSSEALCTALVVHYLAVERNVRNALGEEKNKGRSEIAALFTVPLLGQCCPSLSPVIRRLWRSTLSQDYRPVPAEHLAAWLPTALTPHGAAGAAAALLGNLIDAAPTLGVASNAPTSASLETQAQQAQQACMGFLDLASKLLQLLPLQLLPGSTNQSESDLDDLDGIDSEALASAVAIAATEGRPGSGVVPLNPSSGAPPRLPWDNSRGPLPQGITQQLARTCQGDVLAGICRAALPAGSDAQSPSAFTLENQAAGKLTATVARQVCGFFAQLLHLPGQRKRVLLNLSLQAEFVARLWFSFMRPAHTAGGGEAWVPSTLGIPRDPMFDPGWMLPLWIFSEATTAAIQVLGDQGLYSRSLPLPLTECYSPERPRGLLSLLRFALCHVLWQEAPPSPGGWAPPAAALRARLSRAGGHLMAQLHERNGRRPFAPPEAFYAESLPAERFLAEAASGMASGMDNEDYEGSRSWTLLAHAPFLVPFMERAKVFQKLVATERVHYRNQDLFPWAMNNGERFIRVRRGQVLSDAYSALATASPEQLRGRVRITFVSEHGMEEAGVDGGGVFKEFLESVVKEGFDPEAGLFNQTTDRRLYPNPHAVRAVPEALRLLEFLGRMVGKALWEGILLELPLAPFFLKKVRGAPCDVDDLPTLDPQLARSLASLKDYPGDVSELGLTFSLTDNVLGRTEEVDLIPKGRDVAVTASNASLFVHRVADFKLNAQLRAPVAAFLKGLHALIPRAWVEMFNDRELQELIGGAEGGAALDLKDLQRYVQYAGGYSEDHPVIRSLWEAVGSFTPAQQADLLRFVTSCPRPPLLGFAYLEPPLCIQMAGGEESIGRLPTAATCMNLLKLPPYPGGAQQVREKLLYAIESGAGFELS